MSPRFTLLSKYTHTPLEDSTALQPKKPYVTLYYDSPTGRRALYLCLQKNLNRHMAADGPGPLRTPAAPCRPRGLRPLCSTSFYVSGGGTVTARDRRCKDLSTGFQGIFHEITVPLSK